MLLSFKRNPGGFLENPQEMKKKNPLDARVSIERV